MTRSFKKIVWISLFSLLNFWISTGLKTSIRTVTVTNFMKCSWTDWERILFHNQTPVCCFTGCFHFFFILIFQPGDSNELSQKNALSLVPYAPVWFVWLSSWWQPFTGRTSQAFFDVIMSLRTYFVLKDRNYAVWNSQYHNFLTDKLITILRLELLLF